MRVSGVVVLSEYPVRFDELVVQVQVKRVVSRFDWRMISVKLLSHMDLVRTGLVRVGSGYTAT